MIVLTPPGSPDDTIHRGFVAAAAVGTNYPFVCVPADQAATIVLRPPPVAPVRNQYTPRPGDGPPVPERLRRRRR